MCPGNFSIYLQRSSNGSSALRLIDYSQIIEQKLQTVLLFKHGLVLNHFYSRLEMQMSI